MKKYLWIALIFSGWMVGQPSPARELVTYDPFWDSTQMLTPGQTQVGLESFARSSDSYLSADGKRQNLGQPYGWTTTWNEILPSMNTQQAEQLKQALRSKGLELNEAALVTDVEMEQERLELVPMGAYGLTKTWVVGLRVPIVYTKTRVKMTTQVADPSFSLDSGGKITPGPSLLSSLGFNSKQWLNTYLKSQKYDPVDDTEESTELGDIELLSKNRLWSSRKSTLSLRQTLVFPSGTSSDPYTLVETSSGDGQMDVALGALWDWNLNPRTMISGQMAHRWQLPDSIAIRVPLEGGNKTAAQIDRNVARDLGDVTLGMVNAIYRLYSRWHFSAGYSYQDKSEDRFAGNKYSKPYYETLGKDTDRSLEVARVGLSFRKLDQNPFSGESKELSAQLNFYSVLAGRNVSDASATSLEIKYLF